MTDEPTGSTDEPVESTRLRDGALLQSAIVELRTLNSSVGALTEAMEGFIPREEYESRRARTVLVVIGFAILLLLQGLVGLQFQWVAADQRQQISDGVGCLLAEVVQHRQAHRESVDRLLGAHGLEPSPFPHPTEEVNEEDLRDLRSVCSPFLREAFNNGAGLGPRTDVAHEGDRP